LLCGLHLAFKNNFIRMKKVFLLVVFLGVLSVSAMAKLELSKFSQSKQKELIDGCFGRGYSLTYLTIDDNTQRRLAKPMPDGTLCIVKKEGNAVGYVYVSQTNGRTETFDYAVVFDADLVTSKVKILEYRPPYGGAVASRFWLKQFAGKAIGYIFEYRRNVDAMSGATISATSIVQDINLVKHNISLLHQLGVL